MIKLDPHLKSELESVKERQAYNWDGLLLCCGEEGSGKTSLVVQACKYSDPDFGLHKTCWDPHTFQELITKYTHASILWDESDIGTNSKSAMDRTTRLIASSMQTIRSRRLNIWMVKPVFFDFTKYLAISRSLCLVYVYAKNYKNRGYYRLYGRHAKKMLYFLGKKFENHEAYKPDYRGWFGKGWFFDEDGGYSEYERRKQAAIKEYYKIENRETKSRVDWKGRAARMSAELRLKGVTLTEQARWFKISGEALTHAFSDKKDELNPESEDLGVVSRIDDESIPNKDMGTYEGDII